jgi:hypothetical protein
MNQHNTETAVKNNKPTTFLQFWKKNTHTVLEDCPTQLIAIIKKTTLFCSNFGLFQESHSNCYSSSKVWTMNTLLVFSPNFMESFIFFTCLWLYFAIWVLKFCFLLLFSCGCLVLIFGFLFLYWKGKVCVLESRKKWVWFLGFLWGCYSA